MDTGGEEGEPHAPAGTGSTTHETEGQTHRPLATDTGRGLCGPGGRPPPRGLMNTASQGGPGAQAHGDRPGSEHREAGGMRAVGETDTINKRGFQPPGLSSLRVVTRP